MNLKTADEIIGWCGTAVIILAYALVSFGILSPQAVLYQVMNGAGALGVVHISLKKKAYQPGVLNIVWALIAAVAIIRLFV
jgi:hypothetical protein